MAICKVYCEGGFARLKSMLVQHVGQEVPLKNYVFIYKLPISSDFFVEYQN